MKILLLTLSLLCLLVSSSFALDLADNLVDFQMSTNVEGSYYSDGAAYAVSTANSNGTEIYASGSFVSVIYVKPGSGTNELYVSTDILAAPGTYTSAGLEGTAGDWEVK